MGFLDKIFGKLSKEDLSGAHLDYSEPFWELTGDPDFPTLLQALQNLLPKDCTLYFEGGMPRGKLRKFLEDNAATSPTQIAVGTLWPRPEIFHIPATPQTLSSLALLSQEVVTPELAVHFHVYHNDSVLLQWHDAFHAPLLLSGMLDEEKVRDFSLSLAMTLKLKPHLSSTE